MTNPLQLLRDYTTKKWEVKVKDGKICFENEKDSTNHSFPKETITRFRAKTSKKHYDLLSIFTCLKYADLAFGEYVAKCRSEKANMVSTVDKKELLAYLRGDIDDSPQIQPVPTTEAAQKQSLGVAKPSKGDDRQNKRRRADERNRVESQKAKKSRPSSTATEKKPKVTLSPAEKEAEAVMRRIRLRELLQQTRKSVLCSDKKNFGAVLKIFEKHRDMEQNKLLQPKHSAKSSATKKISTSLSAAIKGLSGPPIIVASGGMTDVLNMYNVKDFLEEERYVSVQEKKSTGAKKQHSMSISHRYNGEVYTFQVVDNVTRFRERDWERVIGVLVSGQAWQFKGWKWGFPVELFNQVIGVHVYLQGSQIKKDVRGWNVKTLQIHPSKRHLDGAACKQFWDLLFSFLKAKFRQA